MPLALGIGIGPTFGGSIWSRLLSSTFDVDFARNRIYAPRTNHIRNSSMQGAVVGTPGTIPTNWAKSTAALEPSVVGTGTESGLEYVDLRFNGTPSATTAQTLSFDSVGISAAIGQTWTNSVYVKLVAGSIATLAAPGIVLRAGDEAGATTLPMAGALTRSGSTRTLTATTPNGKLRWNYSDTVTPVDFTIRIAAPQTEQALAATPFIRTTTAAVTVNDSNGTIPAFVSCVRAQSGAGIATTTYAEDSAGNYTSFAANTLRQTNKGVLIEEARTNLFLNSAAPVTQSITVVAASVYTVSLIGSGTLALSNAGTGTVSHGSPVTITAGTTTLTVTSSGSHTGALVNAQVELGAFATSPIRTTTEALTRNADVVKTADITWLNASAGTLYGEGGPNITETAVSNRALISLDDATTTERIQIRKENTNNGAGSGNRGTAIIVDGGVVQSNTQPSNHTWPDLTSQKVAIAYAANDVQNCFGGTLVAVDPTATLPTLTQCQLGAGPGVNYLNGFLKRVAYANSRLSNATLQQWTT